jgi:ribosome biogenesis GTPase
MTADTMNETLVDLGWSPFFQQQRDQLEQRLVIGRVSLSRREHYLLLTESHPLHARLGGRLRHHATSAFDMPAVGDWVAATPASHGRAAAVVHVFDRRTRFVRKVAGRRTEVQVVAANVDRVAVVTSPNEDFNPRRLERYLAAIRESGADPVFVLNKADLCEDAEALFEGFRSVAADVPVIVTRALTGEGVDALRGLCVRGETLVVVGSSGVGKSTLVNGILGHEAQRVGETRARDGRGRHVTSHRELFVLEGGGLLMDTPGMRELQVWAVEEDPEVGFSDVESLAGTCRFRDCSHHQEPGCAVIEAVRAGTLGAERIAAYHKLQEERAEQQERREQALEVKARHAAFHRAPRKAYDDR